MVAESLPTSLAGKSFRKSAFSFLSFLVSAWIEIIMGAGAVTSAHACNVHKMRMRTQNVFRFFAVRRPWRGGPTGSLQAEASYYIPLVS